jgi:mRNA interferase RelE/StbE
MRWKIETSRNAEKFLAKNQLSKDEVLELVGRAIRRLCGERVNVNMRKLAGEWEGFYRIRRGKIRIIAEFRFEDSVVFIEEIDWRGNIY